MKNNLNKKKKVRILLIGTGLSLFFLFFIISIRHFMFLNVLDKYGVETKATVDKKYVIDKKRSTSEEYKIQYSFYADKGFKESGRVKIMRDDWIILDKGDKISIIYLMQRPQKNVVLLKGSEILKQKAITIYFLVLLLSCVIVLAITMLKMSDARKKIILNSIFGLFVTAVSIAIVWNISLEMSIQKKLISTEGIVTDKQVRTSEDGYDYKIFYKYKYGDETIYENQILNIDDQDFKKLKNGDITGVSYKKNNPYQSGIGVLKFELNRVIELSLYLLLLLFVFYKLKIMQHARKYR